MTPVCWRFPQETAVRFGIFAGYESSVRAALKSDTELALSSTIPSRLDAFYRIKAFNQFALTSQRQFWSTMQSVRRLATTAFRKAAERGQTSTGQSFARRVAGSSEVRTAACAGTFGLATVSRTESSALGNSRGVSVTCVARSGLGSGSRTGSLAGAAAGTMRLVGIDSIGLLQYGDDDT